VVNWGWTLVVSISTPFLFDAINGYVWLIFGITAVIGLVYIIAFMKETRGLPKERVKRLYNKAEDGMPYDPIH
jgi:formate-dependent nitrite reductase membrane component NrfD